MRTPPMNPRLHAVAVFTVLLGCMAGCRPKPPETPPAPVPPAPEIAAASPSTDPAGAAAGQQAGPAAEAGARAMQVDAAHATVSPAPAPPRLEDMQLAKTASKLGVPVDLRYQFDAPPEPGRPATLHLAAVPRVPGSNLTVSIKETAGIDAVSAPLTAQKASAKQAYRQQLSVTRHAGAPAELRVLVTMDAPEGQAFGYFGVPLADVAATTR